MKNKKNQKIELSSYSDENKAIRNIIRTTRFFQILFLFLISISIIIIENEKKIKTFNEESEFININYQKVEPERFYELKNELKDVMTLNDKLLINGVIRKHKPKKCLEVGTAYGGSASVILNALRDIEGSKLYSVDISDYLCEKKVGYIVEKNYPELKNKWKLLTGDVVSSFIEEIGDGIDFLLLDSAHIIPGEMLDFLAILPFLKDNAIVLIHDIRLSLDVNEFWNKMFIPNDRLYSYIRGRKFITHDQKGQIFFGPDYHQDGKSGGIGGIILEKNQKRFLYSYFNALLTHWQEIPKEKHYESFMNLFKRYYKDKLLLNIFEQAYKLNKEIQKRKGKIDDGNIFYNLYCNKSSLF